MRLPPLARRRRLVVAVVAAVLLLAGVTVTMIIRAHTEPAVTPVGSVPGNQLHQFNGDHHAPFISIAEYKAIYDRHDPNYVLVDVREAYERAQARIFGDVWVPLADADTTGWHFLEQYKEKTLVLYCDCPWAEAATESTILEANGFNDGHLRVLHEGIPGWYRAGYPTDTTPIKPCAVRHWPQACYYL